MDLLIFLIALSVLVMWHELGHFLAAKKVGIKVEEFGLGLPPRAWSKKIGETIWSLNWLPIGGFVRMFGEDPHVNNSEAKHMGSRAFVNKKPWQKFIVVIGGVFMNVVMAIGIFAIVYKFTGIPVEVKQVMVTDVVKGSPAQLAGIEKDDVISMVGPVIITKPSELTEEVAKYKGKKVMLLTERGEKIIEREVEVRANPPAGQGAMGIAIGNTKMEKIAWWEVHKSIWAGLKESYYWAKIIFEGLSKMISQAFSGKVPADVTGPIGMYQATSSIRKEFGMLALLHFFGIISVNLAVVNILPFPALDGGRLIFVIYEWVTKKKPNPEWETRIHSAGMIFLLGLILVIAVGDVLKLVR